MIVGHLQGIVLIIPMLNVISGKHVVKEIVLIKKNIHKQFFQMLKVILIRKEKYLVM